MADSKKAQQLLQEGRLLQLATISQQGPWVCSLYYVSIDDTVYWLSWPSRRHSKDVQADPRAAITVAVKVDQPVAGLQSEGRVSIVKDSAEVKRVMDRYIAKYKSGSKFLERFNAGKNEHWLYKFAPDKIVIFDER